MFYCITMNWIQALKHWNSKKGGKYVIPRKGTAEYNEVKALMSSPSKAAKSKAKPVKKRKYTKKSKKEDIEM